MSGIKVEDIWEQILAMEETDPDIRLQVATLSEIEHIKAILSLHKHRTLKANPGLAEALGRFKLVYDITAEGKLGWVLCIGIDSTIDRGGDRELAAIQL